jgi:hypothetical protein
MARFVIEHRLSETPKLGVDGGNWEEPAISALLDDAKVPLDKAAELSTG